MRWFTFLPFACHSRLFEVILGLNLMSYGIGGLSVYLTRRRILTATADIVSRRPRTHIDCRKRLARIF